MTPAPPDPPAAAARPLLLAALAFGLGRAALSCGLLPASGAGLGDTEAYYLAWSMDPSLGYHDHPGLLAWLLALARPLGHPVLQARLIPALCLAATLLLLTAAWSRCGWREAAWGLLAFAAAPLLATGGLLAAPDAPLALGWAAALYLTLTRRAGPAAALLLALAAAWMTASKLLGGVLIAALAAEALWTWRRGLEVRWRLGALLGGAALGLAPTLAFEAAHGWTGLRYHALERHTGDLPFAPHHWGALLGGQLLALSPLLAALLVAALLGAWRSQDTPAPHRRLLRLALLAFVPLALIAASTREAEPHWPILAWLPALGLGAARAARRWPRALTAALAFGVALQALTWLHVATPLLMPLLPDTYEPRFDLAQDLQGWDRVAAEARRQLDRGDIDRVAGYHYTVCGQLAAHLQRLDPVLCASQRRDAFDFLQGGHTGALRPGERILYVRDNRYDEPGPQRLQCRAWGEERWITLQRGGRTVRRFGLQPCLGAERLLTTPHP